MEPSLQSSFIPKKGVNPSSHLTGASGGLFSLLATLIFIAAAVVSVGVFGYEKLLEGRIAKMQEDLDRARKELNPDLIKELSRANARFLSAEEIMKNHRVTSRIFSLLERLTLQNVRFSSFSYADTERGASFEMSGETRSYATLAYQAEVLNAEPLLQSVTFSEFDLSELGYVVFSVKADIDPKLISFEESLGSSSFPQIEVSAPTQEDIASPEGAATTTTP